MPHRQARMSALVVLLGVVLTACGSVEDAPTAASAAAAATPVAAVASEGPVSLTDARGETITLDAPAADVVGLEWGVVENLVSLGVMPVGVADVEGYGHWVHAAPLDDGVTDVGMRGEPSVDALVGLDADLVVATTDLPPNIVKQIEKFVPVLTVRGASADAPIQQMRDNLTLVAQAVGRTAEAESLLADLDEALADGARAISDAGLEGDEFTMADGWLEGSAVSIRMFTAGSLVGAVGEELGLRNAWTAKGDPDYGLAQTDVEGLTKLDNVHFLYYSNDAAEEDPFAKGLKGNAIWKSLPFVQAGNVHRLPDGIWMFGGPRSVEQFVDATVATLTS
jgi:ABC-type Fe3+-hydroxamate transport system substrate-binding protein